MLGMLLKLPAPFSTPNFSNFSSMTRCFRSSQAACRTHLTLRNHDVSEARHMRLTKAAAPFQGEIHRR